MSCSSYLDGFRDGRCYIVTYVDSHLHICTYICRIIHSDTTIKTHEGKRRNEGRKKTSLQLYLPLTLLQGFERVVQGLRVRGCWRPNINFIFWPHCYDRHVVSFLFSVCWGPLHRGFSEGPLGRVWLSLPHLVSNSLEVCWQLLGTPNSTELNNNSTPTRSPTGSLKSNV